MGMFKESIKRSMGEGIRKEDDYTPQAKEFCEKQNVRTYDIEREGLGLLVNMDGDVHVHPEDLSSDGTLPFRLKKVTGNLIVHGIKRINPQIIPVEIGGEIIIDIESLLPGLAAGSSQPEQDDEFGGMEALTKTPPTEAKTLQKLESLISDCVEYGYKIDIESILKSMSEEKVNENKYKLRIEAKLPARSAYRIKTVPFEKLDIYISDDDADILALSAIEKATYLTFLLYDEGTPLGPVWMKGDFFNLMKKIYQRMPDKVEDTINGGLMDNEFLYVTTLNSYRSEIRAAIKERIKNNHLVNKFAIEGYKSEPFKIEKSTPEIREQIKELFYLE